MHFLITAGGTREYIDPVRFITNASTGKMGYALARAALKAGHTVTLITAPTHLRVPSRAEIVQVVSAADMLTAVKDGYKQCDVLIMCAAVSDYTVVGPAEYKLKKKDQSLQLQLEPTVDILQWAGAEKLRLQQGGGHVPLVVGFALEDQDLEVCAEGKLQKKHLDMIVANGPEAIGADASTIHIKTPDSPWCEHVSANKATQAKRIIRAIESLQA